MVWFLEFRFDLVSNRKTESNQSVRFEIEPFRDVNSIENLVFFWDEARSDFNDRLIDLVLDDLEKVDALRICWSFNVVEIDCSERRKKEIDQILSSCFFDESHDVVWTTKKRRNKFEKREAILCSFSKFSRFLNIFNRFEHDVSMSDSKNFSNDSLFDRFRFSSDLKCLLCVFLNDKLVLKRSLNLICSNACQIADFVEVRNNANRCFELRDRCVFDFCYCRADELDINVYLNLVKKLRRWLIEEQIIENVLEFFHVQTISVESFEEWCLID
jgi:hypothetical protein